MATLSIALQRLKQQRLLQTPFNRPDEVVSWLGAVQAQDYFGAKWALGLRMQNTNDASIERAFNEGIILRTHVMRPTWHFVAPADIRWLLELTAPRVNAVNAYMYRQVELDEALFARSSAIIAKALAGGNYLTRQELGKVLANAGIVADGVRLGYIVHRAELDAVVCSGPRRGKQFTYALLAERAPQARTLSRDEALAELTLRYYTGHGPATVKDFIWWSGLTAADAKAGIAMLGSQLSHEVIDSQPYWFSASMPPVSDLPGGALLLPAYDEFLVGFAAFDQSRKGGKDSGKNLVFDSTIVIGKQIVGTWKRTFKQGTVSIALAPFEPLTTIEADAVNMAAQRYGQFVGMPVSLVDSQSA